MRLVSVLLMVMFSMSLWSEEGVILPPPAEHTGSKVEAKAVETTAATKEVKKERPAKLTPEDFRILRDNAERVASLNRELEDAKKIHQLFLQNVSIRYELFEGDQIEADGNIKRNGSEKTLFKRE